MYIIIILLLLIHFNAIFSNACHALTLNVASTSLGFQVNGWTLKTMTLGNPNSGCSSNANLHTTKDVVMVMGRHTISMETLFGVEKC